MSLQKIFDELDLYGEYFSIYVQLLPYTFQCGGNRMRIEVLPTFEYFKENYNSQAYSMSIPHFVDELHCNKREIYLNGVAGFGEGRIHCMSYRYYNYWIGCKYYTGRNTFGKYKMVRRDIMPSKWFDKPPILKSQKSAEQIKADMMESYGNTMKHLKEHNTL